jgi:uncharacterized protein (DUF2147 family)
MKSPQQARQAKITRPSATRLMLRVFPALALTFFLAAILTLKSDAWADDASATPVGYWKTIDDKTHRPRSIVKIVEIDGELHGRILELLAPPRGNPNPVCVKCTGVNKNRPVLGLEILWGMKREAKGWSDGYVLDPEEGRIYRGNVQVIDGGKRLKLFGYVRVVIKIGRSQVWERVLSAP